MENFLNLPEEKQTMIIDAALTAFGANGYKKTSISDIAASAGIAKSMVFHYFGTKKDLYLYLVSYCGNLIVNEVNKEFDSGITDFFERIMNASLIEIAIMKKHPAIMSFVNSAYFESDAEVKDDLKNLLAQGDDFRNKIAFDGLDYSSFKEGIDVKLVMKMLMWMADGFMNAYKNGTEALDLDALSSDFFNCMMLMKKNFYKEDK